MQETQGTWVPTLGLEDALEKEMVFLSIGMIFSMIFNILAWKITWTEDPGGLQSTGSQRVGHNWAHTCECLESDPVNGSSMIWSESSPFRRKQKRFWKRNYEVGIEWFVSIIQLVLDVDQLNGIEVCLEIGPNTCGDFLYRRLKLAREGRIFSEWSWFNNVIMI